MHTTIIHEVIINIDSKPFTFAQILKKTPCNKENVSTETTTKMPISLSTSPMTERQSTTDESVKEQKDELVSKIMEIKQKQQELNEAKEELFSNININDTKTGITDVENADIKTNIDVEVNEKVNKKNASIINNKEDEIKEEGKKEKNIHIILDVNDKTESKEPVKKEEK